MHYGKEKYKEKDINNEWVISIENYFQKIYIVEKCEKEFNLLNRMLITRGWLTDYCSDAKSIGSYVRPLLLLL